MFKNVIAFYTVRKSDASFLYTAGFDLAKILRSILQHCGKCVRFHAG